MTETILSLLFFYVLLYLQVFLHEREHAIEMIDAGLFPESLTLGVPLPFMGFVRLDIKSAWVLEGLPIRIYPLLITGGVKPTFDQSAFLETRSFTEQAIIYSAGVWASLFYPLVGLTMTDLYKGKAKLVLIHALIALVFWLGRRALCIYVFPVVSLGFGMFMLPVMFVDMFFRKPNTEFTIVGGLSSALSQGFGFGDAWSVSLMIGFCLGLMNLLPIFPMDGGRLIKSLIRVKYQTAQLLFTAGGLLVLLVLIGYTVLLETLALLKKL